MKAKQLIKAFLFTSALFCMVILMHNKAYADNHEDVELQKVEVMENVPFPKLTFFNLFHSRYRSFSKISIDSVGTVKVVLQTGVGVNGEGSVWLSRDLNGQDVVGKIEKARPSENEFIWFLDPGTYYVNYIWNAGNIEVGVALIYEPATTHEKLLVSGLTNSNPVELNQMARGFISNLTPNDFYSFTLDEKANVTIEYSFDKFGNEESGTGVCTLYDTDRVYITDGTYSSKDKGSKQIMKVLEPGTYYIRMNGMFGKTTLNIKPAYFDIELIPENTDKWTKEAYQVDIVTSIDYAEVRVLAQDIKPEVINDPKVWNNDNPANVKVDGLHFEAGKSSVYSVRITDRYGNHTMEKIKIANIDVTKPAISGVKNNTSYASAVTIKFSDKQSGIDSNKTTLNGKKVKSGTKITAEGKYVLRVYDTMGNVRKSTFYVDYTAPTSGIVNKKTYSGTVTLRFTDKVSGIKKITINDDEIDVATKTRRFFLQGEYVVKMWDNAGNYRKETFYIK